LRKFNKNVNFFKRMYYFLDKLFLILSLFNLDKILIRKIKVGVYSRPPRSTLEKFTIKTS
jgi:hypothetical protein